MDNILTEGFSHHQSKSEESMNKQPCEMGMTKHSSIVEYANPIHREEINISPVPWQATEATGREDITHPDDTHGGVLQPKWRTEVPGLWTTMMKRQNRAEECSLQLFTASDTYPQ